MLNGPRRPGGKLLAPSHVICSTSTLRDRYATHTHRGVASPSSRCYHVPRHVLLLPSLEEQTRRGSRAEETTDMTTGSVQSFGDLLRRSRLAAGLTQEELAAQAGLSVRGLSDLERGARLAPRRETVQLLAEALQLSAAERTRLESAARQRGAPAAGGSMSSPPHSSSALPLV